MNFNQELYKEFVERKRPKPSQAPGEIYPQKRRSIMRSFLELSDEEPINLQSSISLLKKLSVISSIQGVDHIVNIMERKKKSSNGWNGSNQELLQCRFIYFLWAVIEQETIEMRQFKEIILILANEQNKTKTHLIKELYGEKEGIEELVDCWQKLIEQGAKQHCQPPNSQTQSQQEISDISIIKTKNQGNFDSNKENISYFQQQDISSSRHKYNNLRKSGYQSHANPLQKSYQQRQSKSKLNRSGSSGKMYGRKSTSNSFSSTASGARATNFFTSNENLTVQEQKHLITRLYNCEKYKQREDLKKKIERERELAEISQCSFKPNLEDRSRAMSKSKLTSKEVRGYEKAVDRMKSGYKKNKELKQNLQYRIWMQPCSNQKVQRLSAPKFLSRVKDPEVELFQIVFTIGRHNIRIKIKESDKIGDIVSNIGQIYSLKEDNKSYIRSIIEEELHHYYEAKCQQEISNQQQLLVE